MSALLDTGFLLAVLDADDEFHNACSSALLAETAPFLPDVVLPELAYLILRELGYKILVEFLASVHKGELRIERFNNDDLIRATQILEKYADARVDFVDCVIVAISERLRFKRVLTVDRRHFQLFRPKHCKNFKIIP